MLTTYSEKSFLFFHTSIGFQAMKVIILTTNFYSLGQSMRIPSHFSYVLGYAITKQRTQKRWGARKLIFTNSCVLLCYLE